MESKTVEQKPPPNFRHRYSRGRVAERLAKDDMAIFDHTTMTILRSDTSYEVDRTEEIVANNIRSAVAAAQTVMKDVKPNVAIINNRLTDYGILLIAYRALKMKKAERQAMFQIIKAHLYPEKK